MGWPNPKTRSPRRDGTPALCIAGPACPPISQSLHTHISSAHHFKPSLSAVRRPFLLGWLNHLTSFFYPQFNSKRASVNVQAFFHFRPRNTETQRMLSWKSSDRARVNLVKLWYNKIVERRWAWETPRQSETKVIHFCYRCFGETFFVTV